ncbi:serine hydrolase domain-containing protein [Aurantivibrio infirmus]
MNNKKFIRRKILTAITTIVFVASWAGANAAGIDKARLDAISSVTKQAVDDGKLAGIVTLVAKEGEVQLFESHGYRDLENKTPMTEDTIFRIFSMTKPIAGTALMTLYDEGKFKLDDPVEKYIPEFKDMRVLKDGATLENLETVAADHPMTIRELMSHTGGLVYTLGLSRGPVAELYTKEGILDRNSTLKDMVTKMGKIPLNHQPGTQWVYSVSVDVQGYLVEALSGKSFDVYLQERIFDPLQMNDTAFYVKPEKADRLSRQYAPGQGGKLTSAENSAFLEKPSLFSGGGGLTSTASDYLKFAQMHLNEGELNGVRILSKQAAQLMRQNHLPDSVKSIGRGYPGNVFGLDFAVVNDSEAADGVSEGSFWWWGIAGTWFWIDPVENIIFIGMIQNRDLRYSRQLQSQVKQLMYKPL